MSPPKDRAREGRLSRRSFIGISAAALATASVGVELFASPHVALAAGAYRHPFNEPWFIPRDGEWGNRASWRSFPPHAGVDYNIVGGSRDKVIRAIGAGTIRGRGWSSTYGNRVYIEHDDGMWSHYAHMGTASSRSDGDRVAAGDPIGKVGNTGSASAGDHLHLEVSSTQSGCHRHSTSVDPIDFINNSPPVTSEPPGEQMPFFNHKQSTAALNFAANTTYYATFNGALVTSPTGVGDTDLAGSPAGGPGLYDLDVPFVFSSFVTGSVVRVNLAVQDISSGALDHWYQELFEGSASGEVRVTHSTKIIVPPNKRLFLRITPSANVRLDAWGRIVTNYQGVTG